MLNKKLKGKFGRIFKSKKRPSNVIIPRKSHRISRKNISPNALKVLYRLKKSGYASCIVGGGVRDLLLSRVPKDFDIATDATPEDVRQLFTNSRLIGRRFRLVHVYFSDEIIEVSTFRANAEGELDEEIEEKKPIIKADNTYGTIEEDAWRRDFTVNALFYDISDFSVIDYTGGMEDLKKRSIRMIGDPTQRFHEDPVRLLRAIRLAAKLKFKIQDDTEASLRQLSGLLEHVPPSRLFDELLKLLFDGYAELTYASLVKYNYLNVLFPQTVNALSQRKSSYDNGLIALAMKATDERFADGRSLNPAFLFSILLWPAVQQALEKDADQFDHFYQALHYAIDTVLKKQNETVRIPKRFLAMMRSIWVMQYQLIRRRGKRVYRTLTHRSFRAAFDFLSLRAESGENYKDIVKWWQRFQKANADSRTKMLDALQSERSKKQVKK